MMGPVLLLAASLSLSALFSGSETGFYRAARVRLALDALEGDRIARALLWLANNPALFVATTLTGNNIANYGLSLAVVMAVDRLGLRDDGVAMEVAAPILLSPAIFVYAELLPKHLFLQAPNRLLRRCGPLLLVFALLLAPISALLWSLGRLLETLAGETPLRVKLSLARAELGRVLHEGQEAGVLRPAQRRLALNLIDQAAEPISRICTPRGRLVSVRVGSSAADVFRLARRQRSPEVLVREARRRKLAGYVRVVDLHLGGADRVERTRPLLTLPHRTTCIAAVLELRRRKEPIALVVDDRGEPMGLVHLRGLLAPLFRGR